MAKGLFAAGHVGFSLFLQRLHWTCKKNIHKPSAQHSKVATDINTCPCQSSELRAGGQRPVLRSGLALPGQVTREFHVCFALPWLALGSELCLCLQWNVLLFQAAGPWLPGRDGHWRHCAPAPSSADAKPPFPHLGLLCNPATPWGNSSVWGHCSVTWLLGDNLNFSLDSRL